MPSRLPDSTAAAPRRRCRNDRAEEDPVRQAEEGVVQAALGVGAVASVALVLIRRHRRRQRGTIASLNRTAVGSVTNDGRSGGAAGASGVMDTSGQGRRRQRRWRRGEERRWW